MLCIDGKPALIYPKTSSILPLTGKSPLNLFSLIWFLIMGYLKFWGQTPAQEVSRYIHLNPVEAKMVKLPEYYPWSSYYLFKYPSSIPPLFMILDCLLTYYEGTEEQRQEKYCKSIISCACHEPEFVGPYPL